MSAAAYLESVEKSLVEAVEVEGDRRGDRGSPQLGLETARRTSSCMWERRPGSQLALESLTTTVDEITAVAMNCDVLPKRSASSMRLTACVEVSLPVTPARCADRWLPRLQRRATSRMCARSARLRAAGSGGSDGSRDDLRKPKVSEADRSSARELGQRLDGAADLEAIEEAIITVGRLVQSKGAADGRWRRRG